MSLELKSPAFAEGAPIPGKYDPDAPGSEPFVHWVAYGIPSTLTGIAERGNKGPSSPIREGRNSFGNEGYDGPAPLPGAVHHYRFKLYALDRPLEPGETVDKKSLLAATRGHTLAETQLVGTYQNR